MAKKAPEVNKSNAVRGYMAKHPDATGREVAVALKRDGIKISESLVAKVRQRDAKGPGRKTPRTHATSNGSAGTTKAERIRQIAQGMGKRVRPRDVIATLAAEGVEVSSAQVSTVLRGMGMRRRRGRKPAGAAPSRPVISTSELLSLDSLLAAKKLVNQLGSVEAAKQAVDALVKLS
jgi:hypothetical protein